MTPQQMTPTTPPREPGLLSLAGTMLKASAKLAIAGAVIGAAVAGGTMLAAGVDASLITNMTSMLGFTETGIGTALGAGATLGALGGAITGVPAGSLAHGGNVKHYFQDVAIPLVQQHAMAQGIQQGAQLEHAAYQHEMESKHARDIIAQRSGQQGNEQGFADKESNKQRSLAEMEPMGRA